MNKDFARTITLLRKEKKLSQKDAAQALGISQALLSHYEKGIRECSLSFVVKAADFYKVSCDYLLGRSAERQYDIAELSSEAAPAGKQTAASVINRRLLDNTAGVIYDCLAQVGSRRLTQAVTGYLMVAYYKVFRTLFHSTRRNPEGMFTVPESAFRGYASAAQEKAFADAESICSPESDSFPKKLGELKITPEQLAAEHPDAAGSLFSVIRHAENTINRIK